MLRALFSRQWWWTTLIVVAALSVMVRLGIWQLDRLEQRRAFNARVQAQLEAEVLDLNQAEALQQDLVAMEYRTVRLRGRYDHAQEVALRNQAWGNQPGLHLVTPLVLEGTDQAVMVDRGWIPMEAHASGDLVEFAEPGVVDLIGVIRRSQSRPDFGRRDDPLPAAGEALQVWNLMNLERMDGQITHPLLPVYVQQASDPAWTRLPYRTQPELDLSDGPHLGYAGQWFLFAAVLAVGYPFYLRRNHLSAPRPEERFPKERTAMAMANDSPSWSND